MAPPVGTTAGPIKTFEMDPQDIADLLKKKMMKAKLSRDQSNKLKPPSLTGRDQCQGSGSIYAHHLMHSTKKVIEDRKLNQDVYTSEVGRAVMGEVELTHYGPVLVENYQIESAKREANKEVFTPDIYRTVFDRGDSHSHYVKTLNESQRAEAQRQVGNKGAHSGDIFRNFYGNSTGCMPADIVNTTACSTCPGCTEEKARKQKAIQQESYLKQNIERQQRFIQKQNEKEAEKQDGKTQHEKYRKQVEEFNTNPRISKLCNSTVTGI